MNKTYKNLKRLIAILLIISFILPSYAASTAGDGSAFVTKEEFDKALADFNARLTTFEAGINSKIDSQVTSYLDRNGIWSKNVQSLDATNKTIKYGFQTSSSTTNVQCWFIWNRSDTSVTGDVVSPARNYWRASQGMYEVSHYGANAGKKTLISSVTKSGLMYLTFTVSDVRGSEGITCYLTNYDGATMAAGDHFKFFYEAKVIFYQGTEVKSTLNYTKNPSAAPAFLVVDKFQTTPLMFFVDKGKTIYLELKEKLEKGDGTDFSMTIMSLNTNRSNYRELTVTAAEVY